MTEMFQSGLSGKRLTVALTTTSASLTLDNVPSSMPAGTYRFRIDNEILTGVYSGVGVSFTHLDRHLEGTSAATHHDGVIVRHVITGESLNALRNAAVAQSQRAVNPNQYIRPPALRVYIASNFN